VKDLCKEKQSISQAGC